MHSALLAFVRLAFLRELELPPANHCSKISHQYRCNKKIFLFDIIIAVSFFL